MSDIPEIEEPELEADQPEVEAEVETPEAPAPDDGIEKLKRDVAEARAAKVEAERQALLARQAEHAARADKDDTDIHLVEASIKTLEGSTVQLKDNLKAAWAAQDFDAAADIQQAMAEAAANLLQLRNGLTQMKAKPKQPEPRAADPVEAYAAAIEKGGSPQSAAWVRQHPDYARDPRLNRKLVRAHEDAVEDGHRIDTPEYFAYVENRLGLNQPIRRPETEPEVMSEAAAPARVRTAPPAAPVTRGAPRGGVSTLSAAEREAAEISGISLEDYAKNKAWLQKNNSNYGKGH